jgi:hypothetical protein
MRNSNSPPDFGAQASPAADRAGRGMGGGNQNALLEMLQQRRQQAQQQSQPQQGMGGLGQMGRMMFDRMREKQQAQGGMNAPSPQGPPEMLQPAVEPGGQNISEPPTMSSPSQSQATQAAGQSQMPQQTGMAGLGQAARGLYNRARVNALRGGPGG